MQVSVAARKRMAQVVVRAVTRALAAIPEETARLATLESAVEGALREVGAATLTTVIEELGTGHAGSSRPCPCGGTQTTQHYATCHPQTVLGRIGTLGFLRVFPTVYSGRHVEHPAVSVHSARSVRLEASGVTAYADGERLGELPVDVECVPGALTVLAPAAPDVT